MFTRVPATCFPFPVRSAADYPDLGNMYQALNPRLNLNPHRETLKAMPNGSHPVWMETVRIEIGRDRLWRQQQQQEQEAHPSLRNIAADFSITVWDCPGRGHPPHQVQLPCTPRVGDRVRALGGVRTVSSQPTQTTQAPSPRRIAKHRVASRSYEPTVVLSPYTYM